MSLALSSPVTGAAQTGLTSPTYTVAADTAPDNNGRQYAVTALGGTQTGVTTHSVSSPFTVTFWRTKSLRSIGRVNSVGQLVNNPVNTYKVIVRKGSLPLADQPYQPVLISCTISVPAGSDANDAANVRAALSLFIGAVTQVSSDLGTLATTGVL
jgi:hypothetical protein